MARIQPVDDGFEQWDDLLALILSAFAYMDGVIDPPSSAKGLTSQSLRDKARQEHGFVAIQDRQLLGCMFCKPAPPDCLYIGKLAVHPSAQGRGIGLQLLAMADAKARALGFHQLMLETRIELTGNHERFSAWGFIRTAENRHDGFDRTTSVEMRKILT